MAQTSIEWTRPQGRIGYTFNPWWGCEKISPGCANCYAATLDHRLGGDNWGQGPRRFFESRHWDQLRKWNAQAEKAGEKRLVFCASMADLFERHRDAVILSRQEAARHRLGLAIRSTPNLIYLLLTKRPENWVPIWVDLGFKMPTPENVWLGVTVESPKYLWRIGAAATAPMHGRWFISYEPALAAVDFARCLQMDNGPNWVIAGGESGPGARAAHPDWFRSVRDQCASAGVPFFFKQWGEWVPATADFGFYGSVMPDSGERATWIGWDGQTKNPSSHGLQDPVMAIGKIGKRRAGRILDGQEHNGFPSEFL